MSWRWIIIIIIIIIIITYKHCTYYCREYIRRGTSFLYILLLLML